MFHVPNKLFLWQMLKEFQVPKIVPGSKSQWSGGKHLFISFSSLLLQQFIFVLYLLQIILETYNIYKYEAEVRVDFAQEKLP